MYITNIVINIKMSFINMNSFEFVVSSYTCQVPKSLNPSLLFKLVLHYQDMSSACFEVLLNSGYSLKRPIKEFIDFAPINTFQEMYNVYNFVFNSVFDE